MKSYKHFSIIEREILLILHELGLRVNLKYNCRFLALNCNKLYKN